MLSEGVVSGLHLDIDADIARRGADLLDDPEALEALAGQFRRGSGRIRGQRGIR